MKTTLLIPDIQYPYHDTSMLDKLLDVADDIQPDQIVLIGDGPDFKEVSRWSKGTAEEYKTTLGENILGFRSDVLVQLRDAAPESKIIWIEGNHCSRIKDFVRQYGFPLGSIRRWEDNEPTLSMESMFGLNPLRIEYVKGPMVIAPGVLGLHGHEAGGYAASPAAWDLKFLRRHGSEWSVVFGHTHQGFLTTSGFGFAGDISNRFIMNVGSIMRPESADYVKDGAVNWTHSFGLLHDDGVTTWPELIVAKRGSFMFKGEKY
jgi:predicted phosphodiesterase